VIERVTSRHNPLAERVRKLSRSRAYREAQGEFVCEGPKLLEEALKWRAGLRVVIAAEGVTLPHLPPEVMQVTAPDSLLEYLADTKTPQGVLAVCALPAQSPPRPLPAGQYLVLEGVQDPGNVGTIWRTADAFGAEGLFLLPGCADPFGPKTVRATMGACFRLPVWPCDGDTLPALLREGGIPLYAAALRADSEDVRRVSGAPAAVVIGSEGRGVSAQLLSRCDGTLRIPMEARCESLNAAVAAAVILWELYRDKTPG